MQYDLTKLGYIKDSAKKSRLFSFRKLGAAVQLPDAVSYESLEGSILDQNQTGSCTGHGSSQWLQVAYAMQGKPLPFRPSPKGIYTVTRDYDRRAQLMPGQPLPALTDSGGMPADIVLGIAMIGIRALVMPSPQGFQSDIDTSNVNDEETLGNYLAESQDLMASAQKIDPAVGGFAQNAAQGVIEAGALGIGVFVDSAFLNWNPASGPMPTVNLNDPNGGGHWLALTSYRHATAADIAKGIPAGKLIFRGPNSWTAQWGIAGHWEVTEDWLAQSCSDCYMMKI